MSVPRGSLTLHAATAISSENHTLGRWVAIGVAGTLVWLISQPSELGLRPLWILSLVQLAPFLISVATGCYSIVTIASLDYFVTYSVSKLNVATLTNTPLPEDSIYGCQVATICCLVVFSAYYIVALGPLHGEALRRRYRGLEISREMFWGCLVLLTLFPFIKDEVPGSIAIIFLTLMRLVILLVFTSVPKGMPENRARYLVVGVNTMASLAYFLVSGSMGNLGVVMTVALMVGLMQRVRSYLILVAVGVFLALMVQTVKYDYRNFIQVNDKASISEKLGALGSLLNYRVIEGKEAYDVNGRVQEDDVDFVENLQDGFQRVGEFSLDIVLDQTPATVPFWEGETYEGLAYIFIPRILWPEKPAQVFYNKFGRLYGVLSSDDYFTSVSVNYMAEAYMNYGFQWLYFLCALVGIFWAGVEYSLKTLVGGNFVLVFLIYAGVVTHWGANLTILLNSSYTITIVLLLSRPFLRKFGRRDAYS